MSKLFKDNSLVSKWVSIKKLIAGRLTSMELDTLLVSDAYIALLNQIEDSHNVSVCIEVVVNKLKPTGFNLIPKAVPADDFLINDTRLNSHDGYGHDYLYKECCDYDNDR